MTLFSKLPAVVNANAFDFCFTRFSPQRLGNLLINARMILHILCQFLTQNGIHNGISIVTLSHSKLSGTFFAIHKINDRHTSSIFSPSSRFRLCVCIQSKLTYKQYISQRRTGNIVNITQKLRKSIIITLIGEPE